MKGEKQGGKFTALKLVLKLEPLQLGVLYATDSARTRKRLYIVELQNLLLLNDAERITEAIYAQHAGVFRPERIPFVQVHNLLQKMMEFIHNEIMDDDELLESNEDSPARARQHT